MTFNAVGSMFECRQ